MPKTDVASLELRIGSTGAKRATDRLAAMERAGTAAERAIRALEETHTKTEAATKRVDAAISSATGAIEKYNKSASSSISVTNAIVGATRRLVVQLAAAYGAYSTLNRMVAQQRAFDTLEATLTTVTGSAENAKEVYAVVTEFALQTPYDIDDLVEAFIKLKNYGLDPSERALLSYGNTAAAMGKSLEQTVDAVAAASTGNFMALRSFGIRAQTEMDQVVFHFQGAEHRVKNTAEEIEKWLMALGENEFAGAMEARIGKLDDTILYLEEVYNNLLLSISQSGVGDFLVEQTLKLVDVLQELDDSVASGQLPEYFSAWAEQWDGWVKDGQYAVSALTNWLDANWATWREDGAEVVDFLIDAFLLYPATLRANLGMATVYFAAWVDRVIARTRHMKEAVVAIFTDDTWDAAGQRLEQRLNAIRGAQEQSIASIRAEHEATRQSFKNRIREANALREAYEKEREARAKNEQDRLARYRTERVDSVTARELEERRKEFDRVVAALRTEEEALEDSYRKRRAIIEAHTAAESEQRADLLARLDAEHAAALERLQAQRGADLERLRGSLLTEEETIRESYERRLKIIQSANYASADVLADLTARLQADYAAQLRELEANREDQRAMLLEGLMYEEDAIRASYEQRRKDILEATVLTEEEKQAAIAKLAEQERRAQRAARDAETQETLDVYENLFSGIAALERRRGEEQTEAYRVLHSISKAFSIASASMSIATGIAKAQELGFPANLAEMARIGSLGVQIISTIKGSNFAGMYDDGGRIPAGKIGIVGEYGPEFVQGPAHVTSRKDTRRLIEKAASGDNSKPSTNIRIVNAFDANVVGDYIGSDAGEEVILNVIKRNQTTIRTLVRGA